ncbi:MAG: pyruvate dehydrogenase complex E1 component subunit beta [Armatimonadota bacterium]|nr:pyruvate dehydrogenase complex E1 component subunit beta [Armatimonadota bacterium]
MESLMAQTITYRDALNQALREEMRRDPNILVLGEDVAEYGGAFKVTEGLLDEFGPARVIDTPISEEAIAGTGIGAAMVGLRPVIEMMTINFTTLAMDQIVNHAAKLRYMSGGQIKIPLVIRAAEAAGLQLGAQHSQNLESWYAHVPGLKVVAPSIPYDAKGLLKSAIRDDNPIMFIEHEALYNTKGEVPDDEYLVPLGKAEIKRQGKAVTIISYLRTLILAIGAAEQLAEIGIDAEVIDIRTLKPLDMETIVASVKKTHRAVIVEEDWKSVGMGAEIAARIIEGAFDYLDAPIARVALAEVPMPYSKPLEQLAVPSQDDIVSTVRQILGMK